MTRRANPASGRPPRPAPTEPAPAPAEPGYRIRFAIFKGRARVFFPSGHDAGSKKRGFPTQPPPPYRPPPEHVLTTSTFEQARDLVRELRCEHGEFVAIHVERIEAALPAAPRATQTSLADLDPDQWPSGWPRRYWMGE